MKKENNYKNVVLFGAGYWGKNHLRELNNCTSVSSNFVVQFFLTAVNKFSITSDVKSLVFSGNCLNLFDGISL